MKSVLIIGLGNFGTLVARQISKMGHEIMAIDKDEERVNSIMEYVTDAQIGDSTNEDFLRSLGINNYDVCIVTIENDFQSSLVTTATLKELGGKFVIARAQREIQEKFLLRNGADQVVNPDKQMAKWTAIRYTSDHILDYIQLDENHGIYEVNIPDQWIGKTVGQIDIRKKYGINIMGVKEKGNMLLSVTPDTYLGSGKSMLVLGENKAIQKCFHL
ncbi:trk system potassium uptake protein TrkA [Acetitomaculum ruminis DSM 5522]|uniref:Trk system potassium uptake protein TrkA n=1 Tax=Acetitomaculum ruminis DSM 5522 TaxID=1120918 RepID=A0A1I0YW31_9FIRM|nr:TrkA family potassium uptake protein [Acetitomaculum ruminis]SFB17026.1 trk system potassium uptake protein TrkA [Acetitomaculum ruminis DSM 5522]